ncbi:MAG: hypothetical protein JNK79_18350 [Chitinophagaceae bacterium]|nr:hypothetical protein [Chitinophagaceae bacterium]
MITASQIEQFINEGYIKIEQAVPPSICSEIVDILWKDLGVDRNDRSTWTKPVIRLWFYDQDPFNKAVNMPVLTDAYDKLVGAGNWIPRSSIGTFPVRFPSADDPGDTGWHVDSSFPGDDVNDFSKWRINVFSKGRALLMLFLFSDIGDADAPTRIRAGSHIDVAKALAPFGENGLGFMEIAQKLDSFPARDEILATGKAGTVYLCHPFLVHAAQPHSGVNPRFLAQPSLELMEPFSFSGNLDAAPPVEKAIRLALS